MSENGAAFYPGGIGDRVWHYGVWPVLRLLARDDLTVYRRLRTLVNVTVIGAIVLVACAVLARTFALNPAKLINIAGLMFDIAGVFRLFLFEQIGESLRPFQDEKEYPRGPPSVAMRELIMPEAGPYSIESPESAVAEFWYRNRGVVFLVVGFVLQVIATLMG
jgi:hypothetical protein